MTARAQRPWLRKQLHEGSAIWFSSVEKKQARLEAPYRNGTTPSRLLLAGIKWVNFVFLSMPRAAWLSWGEEGVQTGPLPPLSQAAALNPLTER